MLSDATLTRGNRTIKQDQPMMWWAVTQLTSAAALAPLWLVSGSQRLLVDIESAAVAAVLAAAIALCLFLVTKIAGLSGWRALELATVVTILLWSWPTKDLNSSLSWMVFGFAVTVFLAVAWWLADQAAGRVLFFAIPVTLFVIGSLWVILPRYAGVPVLEVQPHLSTAPTHKPDILLIVMDGYPRNDVLFELTGFDNTPFTNSLEAAGFNVSAASTANYTSTHLSLASMLNMELLIPAAQNLGPADHRMLTQVVSGENSVVQTLRAAGYSYVHGTVPYWFSECTHASDSCLDSSLVDFTAYGLVYRTPLGHFFNRPSRNPAAVVNQHRVSVINDYRTFRESLGSSPVFVFIHLILPHPPLLLDGSCELRGSSYDIHRLHNPGISQAEVESVKNAWLDQIECANVALSTLIAELDSDAIVIATSDHGPDFQFRAPIDALTKVQLDERFSTFTAMRLSPGCSKPDAELDLVNVFRLVFGCLSGGKIPLLDGRYFVSDDTGRMLEYDEQGFSNRRD